MLIHRLACPGCGIELAIRDDAQEICSRCGSRVFGERFAPERSPVPHEIRALAVLREQSHWDRLLASCLFWTAVAWMFVFAGGLGDGMARLGPLNMFFFLAAGLGAAGAWRIRHLERRGILMALWGFAFVGLPVAGLLAYEMRRAWDIDWDRSFVEPAVAMLVIAAAIAPIGVLLFYLRHPVFRYRFGFIAREDLERMLGPNRYSAMIHRLSIDGGWD